MKYRYFLSLALMAFFAFSPVNAQKRTLEEVKKSIGDLSADLKAYKCTGETETGTHQRGNARPCRNMVAGCTGRVWHLRQESCE